MEHCLLSVATVCCHWQFIGMHRHQEEDLRLDS